MKIIAVERYPNQWPQTAADALASDEVASPECLPVSVIADSALVRQGTPMFIPDFARHWELSVVPFLTIGRLGKSIGTRFAHRYIDSWGIAMRLTPPQTSAQLPPAGFQSGLTTGFDGAFAPGTHFPADLASTMTISTGSGETVSLTPGMLHAEETVALISRYMMLKMGDIIIPCHSGLSLPVAIGSNIGITLNSQPAIKLKLR